MARVSYAAALPSSVGELLRDTRCELTTAAAALRPPAGWRDTWCCHAVISGARAAALMAALDVSAAAKYSDAANMLVAKGRYTRAAEQWGKAADAARALGAPDCLVVANIQARRARCLAPCASKR